MMRSFERRLEALPLLGLGVSTEYGAMRASGALDLSAARAELPHCVEVLEVGVEVSNCLLYTSPSPRD